MNQKQIELSRILHDSITRMKQRYIQKNIGNDSKDALEIQNFLQALKVWQMNHNRVSGATDVLAGLRQTSEQQQWDVIFNALPQRAKQVLLYKNVSFFGVEKDFSGKQFASFGGINFEKRLDTVLYTIANLDAQKFTYKEREKIGANTGHMGTTPVIVDIDNISAKITQKLGQYYASEIRKNFTEEQYTESVISGYTGIKKSVSEKVDNKGYSVTVTSKAYANPKLSKIASLLSSATFTVKNYINEFGHYWRGRNLVQSSGALRIGATSIYRVLFSVYPDLGFSGRVLLRLVYGGIYSAIKPSRYNSNTAKTSIYYARAAYEIAGFGQIYNDSREKAQNARFLIWNDPGSADVYVQSTAKMINELFEAFDPTQADGLWTTITVQMSSIRS